MNRREHNKLMKPLCEKLNALIPIRSEENLDKLNTLIAEMQEKVPGFCMSWDKELYIDCNCSDENVMTYVLTSGTVHFEPSDYPKEHPGVVARYKPECKQPVTAEEIKGDIEKYESLEVILEQYTDEVQGLRQDAACVDVDSVVYYDRETGQKHTLAFYPYRTLSVQTLIDCLTQHIKDIEREMEAIKEKYKGIIDFEN